MQTLQNGYQAMGVLWDVNWERLVVPAALAASLAFAGHLGTQGLFF